MLLLWILSLAASFLLPASGEVETNFDQCSQFFLDGKAPALEPVNAARICQFYKGRYRFATMYYKDGRIPMFSAYKFRNPDVLELDAPSGLDWKIEPQLALPGDRQRKSMESEDGCDINLRVLAKSQAVSQDYTEASPYDKGQLAPASHFLDRSNKAATYTLTNFVPLFEDLLHGGWSDFVGNMRGKTSGCRQTYVIVGVVPGDESISGGRVNIPSHIWAAVCCVTKQGGKKSWGVIAENNQDMLQKFNLKMLENQLNDIYGKKGINLFNGGCY